MDYTSYISDIEYNELLEYLTTTTNWSYITSNSRKVIQMGHAYNYKFGSVMQEAIPFESPISNLRDKLNRDLNRTFNQCIINRYTKSQGISPDDTNVFANVIACVTIGSPTTVTFTKDTEVVKQYVDDRNIMHGASRYRWKHQIKPSDNTGVRYSLTFRSMKE